jgi:hypothetical protein
MVIQAQKGYNNAYTKECPAVLITPRTRVTCLEATMSKHTPDSSSIQLALPFEEWLDIPGYEGLYQASNRGRIRRVETDHLTSQQIVRKYYAAALWKNGKRKSSYVHRLVALAFIGDVPMNHEVNHKDGNRLNNNASNLEYVTRSENIQHAMRTTGSYRGTKHPASKLTEEQVHEIRASKETRQELAKRFNVSYSCICYVLTRGWRHINADET